MEPYDIHKKTADPPQVKTKPPGYELFDECAVGIALLPGRIHAVVMDRSGRVREERSRAITSDSDKVVTTINKLGEELVQSAEPYGAIRGIGLSISGRVTRQRTCVLEALDWDHSHSSNTSPLMRGFLYRSLQTLKAWQPTKSPMGLGGE